MNEKEVKHRRGYIEQFSNGEISQIHEEICCGCKGDNSWWWDSDCRNYCDSFLARLQQYDAEDYV